MNGAYSNITLVTMDSENTVIKDAGIVWENGLITLIGTKYEVETYCLHREIPCIDGGGTIIFPGLINTHMHMYQNLLKGIGSDLPLETWWYHTIKPAGLVLDKYHVESAVKGAVLEAVRSGTTTMVDYFQVHAQPGLSETELDVVKDLGIRFVYARGFRTSGTQGSSASALVEKATDVFSEVERLKIQYRHNDLISLWIAPAGVWAMDKKGLEDTALFSLKNAIPCTMHMLETETDNIVCRDKFGLSAMEVFNETGLLDIHLLAVHVVHITLDELDLCRDKGVCISHNPVSNMYLGSGISPVIEMRKRNIIVSLASDGAASNNTLNMLEVLKTTALLHRVTSRTPAIISAEQVLRMATIDAARALGMQNCIGSLEVGKDADFFRYDPMLGGASSPCHDPVAMLVFAANSRSIVDVLVKGQFILKQDTFISIDEREVYTIQQQAADDLIQKAGYKISNIKKAE